MPPTPLTPRIPLEPTCHTAQGAMPALSLSFRWCCKQGLYPRPPATQTVMGQTLPPVRDPCLQLSQLQGEARPVGVNVSRGHCLPLQPSP